MTSGRSRTLRALGLGALMLIALAVRLRGLGGLQFWYDEIVLWLYAVSGVPPTPIEAPLMSWTLLAAMWLFHTTGPFIIHLLPTVLMVLTVPLMFVAGSLADGRESTGWIAALLVTVSPMSLYYSREGRPYALFMLLSLAACIAVIWAYRRNSALSWSVYAALLALCGLTHLLTVQIVVAFGAFALAYAVIVDRTPERLQRFVRFVMCTAIAGGIGLAWAVVRALGSASDAIAIGRGISGVYPYGVGRYLRNVLVNFGPGPIMAIRGDFTSADALGAVYGALFVLGLWRLYVTDRKPLLLFATFLFPIPLILTYVNVAHSADFDWARYISQLFLPFLVVCSIGFQALASVVRVRGASVAAAVLLAALVLPGTLSLPQRDEYRDYRDMSSYLASHATALAGVIVLPFNHNFGDADDRVLNIYYQQKRDGLPVYALTDRTIRPVDVVPGRVGQFARVDAVPASRLPAGEYALLWKRPMDGCDAVSRWVDSPGVVRTRTGHTGAAADVTVCDLSFSR